MVTMVIVDQDEMRVFNKFNHKRQDFLGLLHKQPFKRNTGHTCTIFHLLQVKIKQLLKLHMSGWTQRTCVYEDVSAQVIGAPEGCSAVFTDVRFGSWGQTASIWIQHQRLLQKQTHVLFTSAQRSSLYNVLFHPTRLISAKPKVRYIFLQKKKMDTRAFKYELKSRMNFILKLHKTHL